MEFHEKLQELRKQKGITQEELAARLYVSRTAVSKWESGRGYPNIESLKAVARFYEVTVDQLLSSEEVLTIADEDRKKSERCLRDPVFGLLDICPALLLILPLLAAKTEEGIRAASLLTLSGVPLYLVAVYTAAVIGSVTAGVLNLALQTVTAPLWMRIKTPISLAVGVAAALLFTVSRQPYAAVFAFSLLAIKAVVLFKKP